MEDINKVVELINSVGFPIVVAVGVMWLHFKGLRENQKVLVDLKHTIAANTKALEDLNNHTRK